MVLLVAASGWWVLVQWGRIWGVPGLNETGFRVPATLTHAVVMVMGFMPLFFAGFLFTAGPRWLNVEPWPVSRLQVPLLLQAAGWLLWLLGGSGLPVWMAVLGLTLALAGLVAMYLLFWQLIWRSTAADRVHAMAVGVGGLVGIVCLAGVLMTTLLGYYADLALVLARTALWGWVVVTFAAVAHRMLPFFTSSALPMIEIWRPFWVLWLMLGIAAFEVLAVWVDWAAPSLHAWPAWTVLVIVVEAVAGGVLLWLAVVWGLVQSVKIRLLGMLHLGFMWLGLALVWSALSQGLWLGTGQAILGLGALHALTMGFLGSMMVAMVTRVCCGHSGRALVADDLVWVLFLALQVTVVVRLAAAVSGAPVWLTLLAAALWAVVMLLWSLRYGNWLGRPRFDGKPG